MNCPYCGLYMSDPSINRCLRCGLTLPGRTSSALGGAAKSGKGKRLGRKLRNLFIAAVATLLLFVCLVSGYFILGSLHSKTGSTSTIPGSNAVLFSDPLTTDINNWSNDGNHCFFQGQAYHVKNNSVCYASIGNIGDATISVQVKQVDGSLLLPYGLVFRRVSQSEWYQFTVDSSGNWAFSRAVSQTKQQPAVIEEIVASIPNAVIKQGFNASNTLLVQAKGSHFVFFINGAKVGEADDSTYANGEIGLLATGTTEVAFNNIKITN